MIHIDFAENYTSKYVKEIQAVDLRTPTSQLQCTLECCTSTAASHFHIAPYQIPDNTNLVEYSFIQAFIDTPV